MPSGLFNWRSLTNICQARIWFIIGRRYASVLPHPVSAVKSVLCPPRIVGIPSFCKCNIKTVITTFRNYTTQINISTFINTSFSNPYCLYNNSKNTSNRIQKTCHETKHIHSICCLHQCFSTAGPRPGTRPWHPLYRAMSGSPGICHFSFLSIFQE